MTTPPRPGRGARAPGRVAARLGAIALLAFGVLPVDAGRERPRAADAKPRPAGTSPRGRSARGRADRP